MDSNGHDRSCTHCGCDNPIWKVLKEDIFKTEYASNLVDELGKTIFPAKEPAGESIVFTGGVIYPVKNGNMDDTVAALGIHNGEVVTSGTLADVEARMKENGITYRTVILDGKTLLPGLIEPHVHIIPTASMRGWLDLGGFDGQKLRPVYDWTWLKDQIKRNIPKDKSTWILGRMVDPALMPFKTVAGGPNQLITFHCNQEFNEDEDNVGNLDSIVSDIPLLMMSASMHTIYLNTAAFKAVYNNPLNGSIRSKYKTCEDYIKANQSGLEEMDGMKPAILSIPIKQDIGMLLQLFKHVKEYFDDASSRGVTMLYDALMDGVSRKTLDLYYCMHLKQVRVGYAWGCDGSDESVNNIPKYRPAIKEDSGVFYQGSVKLVSDGSNQGLTGYQSEYYCCEPADNKGIFNFHDEYDEKPIQTPDRYKKIVRDVMNTGWPLMIHANGNQAIQFTLEAYDSALHGDNAAGKRHRIEHCSLLTEEDIKTMVRLGVVPSFLIGHVGYWGYVFKEAIFEDKAHEMLDLCRSALDNNLKITLHSDCSVTPLGPLRSMEQAITRKMEGKRYSEGPKKGQFITDPEEQPVLNEAQRISRKQALKAVTYDAAWQCHAEGWTGSLNDGNFADFVILEKDPLNEHTTPAVGIRDIKVCETWKGGHQVYLNPAK